MNPNMTANTKCPANIFASKRIAKTTCFINSPRISITRSIGFRKIAITKGKSIFGTCPIQKPTAPYFFIPEPTRTRKVETARIAVVDKAPVGDAPNQGTRPAKLQKRMKKKRAALKIQ